MFPGNGAPLKHPDLVAVSFLTTSSQRENLKVQLPCLGRELPGKLWVTLSPAVAGLRKEEL